MPDGTVVIKQVCQFVALCGSMHRSSNPTETLTTDTCGLWQTDGSAKQINPDGTVITTDMTGKRHLSTADGGEVVLHPDGTRFCHAPDGTVIEQRPAEPLPDMRPSVRPC